MRLKGLRPPVCAKTSAMSALGALVMKDLRPEMTQPSPSLVAVVSIAKASLPALSSVKACAASSSPRASLGRSARCSAGDARTWSVISTPTSWDTRP